MKEAEEQARSLLLDVDGLCLTYEWGKMQTPF
jgi:hypothetical protein